MSDTAATDWFLGTPEELQEMQQRLQQEHDQRAADLAAAEVAALELIDRIRNGHAGRIGHAELIARDWLDEEPDRILERAVNLCVSLALCAAGTTP